jgi:predicted Zn-dependent peptidase
MPEVSSVSIGFFVGTGSRDETTAQAGISHFLEHLLFKGTPRRSARQIAEAIDAVGGDMNAFTSKEHTTFYTRTLAEQLPLALDILCDILVDPALRAEDVDAERQVILEEVLMHLDEPGDVAEERLLDALFPDHPLGREVLGLPDVIAAVGVPEIRAFFDRHYLPGNLVVAAAGDLDHEEVLDAVERRLAGRSGGRPPVRVAPSSLVHSLDVVTRDTEQAQLMVGMRAPDRHSDRRFALAALNHSLGGGVSSRLFQAIREERGLAYSVVSDRSAFEDAGALVISLATSPDHVHEVLGLVHGILDDLARDGVSERELEVAKGHLKADLLLSLEDSGARMSRIGGSLMLYREVLAVEELLRRIEAVSLEDVAGAASEVFGGVRSLAVVGPFEEAEFASQMAVGGVSPAATSEVVGPDQLPAALSGQTLPAS